MVLRKINRIIRKLMESWITNKTVSYLAVIFFFWMFEVCNLLFVIGSRCTLMLLLCFALFWMPWKWNLRHIHKEYPLSAAKGIQKWKARSACVNSCVFCVKPWVMTLPLWRLVWGWMYGGCLSLPPNFIVKQEDACSLPFSFWLGYQEAPSYTWFRCSFHFICHFFGLLDSLKEEF